MQDEQLPEELQDPSEELFPTEANSDPDAAPQTEPESGSSRESRLLLLFGSLSRLGIADSVKSRSGCSAAHIHTHERIARSSTHILRWRSI